MHLIYFSAFIGFAYQILIPLIYFLIAKQDIFLNPAHYNFYLQEIPKAYCFVILLLDCISLLGIGIIREQKEKEKKALEISKTEFIEVIIKAKDTFPYEISLDCLTNQEFTDHLRKKLNYSIEKRHEKLKEIKK
jgi:hypothetical protein